MRDKQTFWDASAVVPLCIHEGTSTGARQIMREHPQQIVWWGTLAEARSAFARGQNRWIYPYHRLIPQQPRQPKRR